MVFPEAVVTDRAFGLTIYLSSLAECIVLNEGMSVDFDYIK